MRSALGLLAALGMPLVEREQLCSSLASQPTAEAEARIRLEQLADGVQRQFIQPQHALRLVREQPQILQLGFGSVYEDEKLVCINKPNDVLLRVNGKSDGSTSGPSVHEWLALTHPSVVSRPHMQLNLRIYPSCIRSNMRVACVRVQPACREVSACTCS